ncbi:penicillin acylase family protein [Algoriphagus namhaensis]|uniref:Penicillin acylase family protein n=1 Tax=Algoriphagus namhaensis TaxID=915353 RepID=A0ABV8AUQ5_9BACT
MKNVVLILGSLALIAVVGMLIFISAHSPQYKGDISLQGLDEEVEVLFDEYGVPHIYASNETDAYKTLGYVHAQDRLFQLEMMRRVGTGTLAEFLGADLLEIDQFFRTLGIPKHALESTEYWQNQPQSPWKLAAEAYIAGVNQFIQEGNLPMEYSLLGETPREFTINDVHAITGYMAFTFAMAVKTDPMLTKISKELGPDYLKSISVNTLPEHVFIPNFYPEKTDLDSTQSKSIIAMLDKLPVPLLEGSNSWVIAGSKSASGKVLFANDTHIGFSSPSVWYEAHIEYPGFRFYGNHLAGLPFGLVGHTEFHSIGLTMFENDDQDFFLEKLNPSNSNEIMIGNQGSPISSRIETIQVKEADAQEFEIKETIHGPILNPVVPEIAASTENPVSSWWVYTQEPTRALEATYKMAHAKSIDDVAQAAALIHAPGLNIMYGDAEGNIAWWAAARLPERNPASNSKIFRNGSDPDDQPAGWLPFTENPQSINPPWGYVVSANNQTDTLSNGTLVPGYYYPGDRYQRIAETIASRNDWTVEDLKTLQLETINTTHPKNVQVLLKAVSSDNFSEFEGLSEEISNWQGTHNLQDMAPTVYYKWLYHTLRLSMSDELGMEAFETYLETFTMIRSTPLFLNDPANLWWDDRNTEAIESKDEIIQAALNQTLAELETQFGENWKKWEWQKAIISVHPHPLGAQKPLDKLFNVETYPLEANAEAVNKLAFRLNGEGVYTVTSGPAMRILLDFENVESSLSVLPTGQSGNRFSPFYKDQANLFAKGKYRSQLMNRSDIEKSSENRLVLKP